MAVINNKYAKTKEYDTCLFTSPLSCEELFPVKAIDDSGVFILNKDLYSKSYRLSDINFKGVTDAEQKSIIINFSHALNSLPCRFSYTVANEYIKGEALNDKIFYKKQGDNLDVLRDSFNEFINGKVSDARRGLYQTIYFTLTVSSDNLNNAKVVFSSLEASLSKALIQIGVDGMAGSTIEPIDINERMQLWYNFTHAGIYSNYAFDYDELFDNGKDWINVISPQSMEFYNDYFVMNGNKYGRVLYMSKFANSLDSDIISELSKIDSSTYITVNSEVLELSAFMNEIRRKSNSVGVKIDRERSRNRKNNDFLSDASNKRLLQEKRLADFTEKVESGDDHYFNTTILMMFFADSYKDLGDLTKKIAAIANIKGAEFAPCFAYQREGINSCFMFGAQEFKRCCNLSAPCEAMFMPFKTQELNEKNGSFYGINRLSQNPIIANRKNLASRHGLFLGMPGFGKSMFAKLEILSNRCLFPEEQILIIDPQNEYKKLSLIDGLDSTIISFDSKKDIYVNPLDVNFDGVDYAGLQEIIGEKADFIFTLFSSCMHKDLNTAEQSVLDRVIRDVYSDNYSKRRKLNGLDQKKNSEYTLPGYMESSEEILPVSGFSSPEDEEREYSPILQDVYQGLLDRDDDVARNLAGHLDVFVNGSLNLFNHRTTIDLSSNFIIFDLSEIKQNISTTCMLVMLEIVRNKIKSNFSHNRWTNVYIDEFHELLKVPAVTDYVIKLWKEVRKIKGIMTGITQNMTDLLSNSPDSARIAAILSNSEYFAMLNQSTIDRRMLQDFLPSISPAMFNFVEGAMRGTGLLKMGSVTVPFDIRMNKNCSLYKFINTDGNDGVGSV